jgi:hypothetical protein
MNFATPLGIASMDGYEPMFSIQQNLYANHRQAGIRYFLATKYKEANPYFIGSKDQLALFDGSAAFQQIYDDPQVTIWEDTLYEPLLQFFDQKGLRLPVSYTIENSNNGVSITTGNTISDAAMIISYNYHKNLEIYINKKRVNFTRDAYGRIVITKQNTVDIVQLVYNPF